MIPKKIAVLAGGPSCEREVSLVSGKAVAEALRSAGFEVVVVDPVGDFLSELRASGAKAAFIALHGTFGEDGQIQRLLEAEGIRYTGAGAAASERSFDKSRAQAIFKEAGIRVPDFRVIAKDAVPGRAPFGAPFVVKPATSGSSCGVTIVRDPSGFQAALEEAFRFSDHAVVDRFVKGRELTVGILGDEALPVVEVIPGRKFYDYEAKYGESGTRYEAPARLSADEAARVGSAALTAYRAIGCEVMGRVDVILSEDDREPYVLEINTIPGLTGKSLLPKAAKAAGIDFPALCVKILELSLNRARVGVDG